MGPKLEDFEVLETIGRGSHGTIRKVRRKCDGELLVWKELHYASMNEAEKQGLVLEVNLLRELHHPNIVRFFNHLVERHTGMLYIFMEYCPGGDLLHLVSKCRKTGSFLEEGFIWRVLKQVCEALRACHDKHTKDGAIILHRDIKPANVFLDKDGNIKVGDFGLARTLNSDASFARTFVGTPYYMSPEVIDGRAYNEQSDIWSLGCLIYELCSLEPPFKATSQSELYNKIKAGKCKRIPIHYSNELWEIIQEMLTLEDFLRPGAFLILHHSALKKNTASKIEVVDDSMDSLLLSLDLNNDAIAIKSTVTVSDEEDSSYLNSLNNTVKEREKSAEEIRMEESLMKEVEMMLKESQLRKEKEKNERLKGNKLNINSLSLTTQKEKPISNKTEMSKNSEGRRHSQCLQERIEKELSPPKCICGGTTWEEWKERLSLVRASEADVKKREMEIEEREREVIKRERRIQAMEQEAKDHLVRAQIYLKQAKIKIPNHHLIPKLDRVEELSDFDATTVSADIGYEEISTVAYLDTEARNNPFLKMRENKSNVIRFNTKLNRSNTLDNPKSRRKHGNYFYLDKENKIPDCNKKERIVASNERTTKDIKLKSIQNENKSNVSNDKKKGPNPNTRQPLITISNENKNGLNSKGSAKTFLNNFRQNLTKHNFRNPGKENKQSVASGSEQKRKPLQAINSSKFQSKGVCAKPTNLPPQIKDNPSLLRQKLNAKDRMLRVYNDV